MFSSNDIKLDKKDEGIQRFSSYQSNTSEFDIINEYLGKKNKILTDMSRSKDTSEQGIIFFSFYLKIRFQKQEFIDAIY